MLRHNFKVVYRVDDQRHAFECTGVDAAEARRLFSRAHPSADVVYVTLA
jgi:hypothetical protein